MEKSQIVSQMRAEVRRLIRNAEYIHKQFLPTYSLSQCHALLEIELGGIKNVKQLSTILNLEKSTTSRLVAQLVEKGLCATEISKKDSRSKALFLTEKGKALVEKINTNGQFHIEQTLQELSEEEQKFVVTAFTLYNEARMRVRQKNIQPPRHIF